MVRFRSLSAFLVAFIVASPVFAEGYRAILKDGGRELPICVVKGSAFEMGKAFGQLFPQESKALIERIIGASQAEGGDEYSNERLDAAWAATSPYVSEHVKEEMRGLAEGARIPLEAVIRAHMIPLISTYSCSSLAVWDEATASGDLFLTRNLDWELELRAHDFPVLVLYLPEDGIAHVNVTFAGYVGCNTGMNNAGIALAEMGDSPDSDKPYDLNGYHFTMFFRDMLYQGKGIDQVLDMLRNTKRIKKYHYVIGSGKEKRAAKIVAHAPNLAIFEDNDPKDEFAPNVMENCVYNDEGRGAFPLLKEQYGKITGESMMEIAKSIPIKGGNVLDVVYNATAFEMWVTYAEGETEAYKLPAVHVDFKQYLDFAKPPVPVIAKTDGKTVEGDVAGGTQKQGDAKFGNFTKEK